MHMVSDIFIYFGGICLFLFVVVKNDFTTTAMHSGYMTDMLVSRFFHRATDIPPCKVRRAYVYKNVL